MKDNGWSVSVESFSGSQHRVVISVSPKYAKMLCERHKNVTGFVMEKVSKAIDYIESLPDKDEVKPRIE